MDLISFLTIAGTMAVWAVDVDIGKELNVGADRAGAVASRAAERTGVIGEVPIIQSEFFGFCAFRENFSQFIMDIGIRSNRGTDIDTDRSSINQLYLFDAFCF